MGMKEHVKPGPFSRISTPRHQKSPLLVLKSIPFQRVKILIRDMKKKNAVEGKFKMQEISQGLKT